MKAFVATKRHIACPRCLTSSWPADHLEPGSAWGPWSCPDSNCTAEVRGTVASDGSIDLEVSDKPKGALVLLHFRGLYLVVSGYSLAANPNSYDFLFHSHQCPTNMLRGAFAVFDPETGIDPHGVLRFVAAIADSEAMREKIEGDNSATLAELLAAFGTDGVPPESKWPERDGGKLPWLAEMRRNIRTKGEA